MARGLNFRIFKVEGLFYLCCENKGADQLHGYCAADLCLCFWISKKFSHEATELFIRTVAILQLESVTGFLAVIWYFQISVIILYAEVGT